MVVRSHVEVHDLLTLPEWKCDVTRMRAGIVIATAVIITVAQVSLSQTPASAPWFGAWRLNEAKSSGASSPPRYKRATSKIEPWADRIRVAYDMVGVRGGITHMEWTGKFDGKDYPMQGVDYVMTNAYVSIDDHNYKIVVKIDGRFATTANVTISPDGRTLTTTTTEGSRTVYERQ